METALELKQISYMFSDGRGITDLSMQVKRGEIYMLYGGHNAGKTLLLQMLTGTVLPQAGTIRLFGNADYLQEKRRMGYVPQKPYSIGGMSAMDMLHYFALAYGVLEQDFEKSLALGFTEKKAVCHLPFYVQKKVNLGIALLGKPDFILLDDPFQGLGTQECESLLSILSSLNEERNMTILLTGQDYELASRIVKKYGILADGKLKAELTSDTIKEECRRCIKIRTPQVERAITVIQNDFPQYEVLGDDFIRVFCPVSYSSKINAKLVSSGIEVCEIGIAGVNPQTFLSALAGGEEIHVADDTKRTIPYS
ncbi:MAG: ATP-binding cassette domain-containing protein [Eubacterium sp.]|nr:ATP-binding cassette domain-containing protein [Eubacterium sp.]